MFESTNIDYLEQENDDQVDILPDSDHIHVNYGYISSFLRIILGLCASLIGTGQISTFLAGRIHLVCSMFTTFFYSACFQPFLMHWIWSQKGWMKKAIFLETGVSVQDFGGNLVVHLSSSLIGTIGILIVSFLHLMIFRKIYNYWTIVRCFQGGLAGTIAVAAAVELYSHLESIAVAAVVSVLFFFVSILIHNSALEDNSNLIASHLIGSFIASFMCPIVAHRANFNSNKKIHILWQFICICVVLAVTAVFAWLIFLIFALSKLLRNKEEVLNHRRATILQKFLPKKGAMERLFMIDSKTDHIVPGESSRRQYVFDKTTNTDNIKVSVSV
ncbi:unnamed protein product [Diabrotica balteata]|uniref:Ammonium transporter AmtB-like domain-containing protein n=1 Tax=Diabrotica balteata TaxID=107213 RepID=A0A9N9TBT6_DIABA|nr:unnamed protein product [Diabrotica balteata]